MIGAAPTAAPGSVPLTIEESAAALEAAAKRALLASLRTRNFLAALTSSLQAAGVRVESLPVPGAQLAALKESTDVLLAGVRAIYDGTGKLQRWRSSQTGVTKWGIAHVSPGLGLLWPAVGAVVVVAGALSAAAWYVGDVLGLSSKVEHEADLVRATTRAELVKAAAEWRQSNPKVAAAIDVALAEAEKAAMMPPTPGMLAEFMRGAGAAGAGLGLGALLAFWLLSRRGKKR